jgi:hypothetical protein
MTTYSEISFEELKDMKISYGDLYWKKSSGSFTKILNAGSVVDFSKIEKFQKVTSTLFFDYKCNKVFVDQGREVLRSLLNAIDEIERRHFREQLISHVFPVFWEGSSKGSVLDLILIFELSFNELPSEFINEMDHCAATFFQRSALSSTLITFISMCLGYTHGSFLKDLYNTCFYFDFSYAFTGFSSLDLESIEEARKSHSSSENIASDVKKSLEMFNYKPKHSRLTKLIKFHHELLNGEGSVVKLNQEEIGDLEKVVIWIENLIPFGKDNYFIEDGEEYLKKILISNQSDLAIVEEDLKNKIINCFEVDTKELESVA